MGPAPAEATSVQVPGSPARVVPGYVTFLLGKGDVSRIDMVPSGCGSVGLLPPSSWLRCLARWT